MSEESIVADLESLLGDQAREEANRRGCNIVFPEDVPAFRKTYYFNCGTVENLVELTDELRRGWLDCRIVINFHDSVMFYTPLDDRYHPGPIACAVIGI